jgi:hypothetical protein
MTQDKKKINIEFFTGFYESIHDEVFDREIEQILTEDYPDKKYEDFRFKTDFVGYSKAYVSAINSEIGFNLEFAELIQPREYNFTTDRIICYIGKHDLGKIESALNSDTLRDLIKERFTNRGGFISFYSNDVDTWKKKELSEWDSVELGTLLDAWLDVDDEFDLDYQAYDYCRGNGQYVNYELIETIDSEKIGVKL